MAVSETSICNMALSDIGAKRINDFDTDSSDQAIQCKLHYEPTRDALIRSHWWRFATTRATLSQDTTDPPFEYDNQFILPTDFLRMKSVYENRFSNENIHSYALEGDRFLTNDSTVQIRYIKKVEDPGKFDPLFVQVLAKQLALQLTSLTGANPKIRERLTTELTQLMRAVKAMDSQETNTIGTDELASWNDARYSG